MIGPLNRKTSTMDLPPKEIGPLFSEKPEPSRPFRLPTGERPAQDLHRRHPTGGQPVLASLRSERGTRIASDVRRFLLLGAVLVGVGIVLAMLATMVL
jgi:hypothetical protein